MTTLASLQPAGKLRGHELQAPCPECGKFKLYANVESGLFFCQRCTYKGKVEEKWRPAKEIEREAHAKMVEEAFALDPVTVIRCRYPRHPSATQLASLYADLRSAEAQNEAWSPLTPQERSKRLERRAEIRQLWNDATRRSMEAAM